MLSEPVCRGSKPSRLACLIHAASVHPEPGSNSQYMWRVIWLLKPSVIHIHHRSNDSLRLASKQNESCFFACLRIEFSVRTNHKKLWSRKIRFTHHVTSYLISWEVLQTLLYCFGSCPEIIVRWFFGAQLLRKFCHRGTHCTGHP